MMLPGCACIPGTGKLLSSTNNASPFWAAFSVLLGLFALGMSITIVNVALPYVQGSFAMSDSDVQWLSTGFLASTTGALLAAPWGIARFGMRPGCDSLVGRGRQADGVDIELGVDGVAVQKIDDRIALAGLGIAGRQVHVDRPVRIIALQIAAQRCAHDVDLLKCALRVCGSSQAESAQRSNSEQQRRTCCEVCHDPPQWQSLFYPAR